MTFFDDLRKASDATAEEKEKLQEEIKAIGIEIRDAMQVLKKNHIVVDGGNKIDIHIREGDDGLYWNNVDIIFEEDVDAIVEIAPEMVKNLKKVKDELIQLLSQEAKEAESNRTLLETVWYENK